ITTLAVTSVNSLLCQVSTCFRICSKLRCIRSTPTEMQSMSENDFECFANTGVNTPETMFPSSGSIAKRPFGGPEHVLRYLGAYTHRVAISNSRLVALSDGNVTFRWRDSAHGNKKRLMTLPADEFLRRFLLHLLPTGFVRIRNFGFLANRNRATLLPLCFRLLGNSEKMTAPPASPSTDQTDPPWNCPVCGGTMHVVERLSAAQLLLRSPPQPDRCAA